MHALHRLAALAAFAFLAACVPQRAPESEAPPAPRTQTEWSAVLADLRAFERTIGFTDTENFQRFAPETQGFPFCGSVAQTYLPYSYEDPKIAWIEVPDEATCQANAAESDVLFTQTEAVGERATPVTPTLLAAPYERLVYVVIHENCHDQFELPHGIEEALCNVIAFNAMRRYGERPGAAADEREALERYARDGEARARNTVGLYARLEKLYARHAQGGVALAPMLAERETIFRTAEQQLEWPAETMNNVWMANAITYARHYAALERAFDAQGRDLARFTAFMRRVDAAKPAPAAVRARYKVKDGSVEYLRAYETAVMRNVDALLARDARTAAR